MSLYITDMYLRDIRYYTKDGYIVDVDVSKFLVVKYIKLSYTSSVFYCIDSKYLYLVSNIKIFRYNISELQRHAY